jgi:hypothetical protein
VPLGGVDAEEGAADAGLKASNGATVTVIGGTAPKQHDGWMWDLTVPGNNDHDFYVVPAISMQPVGRHTYYMAAGSTPILVHNSNGCGGIALGFSEVDKDPLALLDFADSVGAMAYYGWPSGGANWANEFKDYVNDGETQIAFNLNGTDDADEVRALAQAGRGHGPDSGEHSTAWELSYIEDHPDSWSRVTFYRDGKPVGNPFASRS